MFRNRKSDSAPKQKTIKRQLAVTGTLVAGMIGLYIIGKREDAKLKRAFAPNTGE